MSEKQDPSLTTEQPEPVKQPEHKPRRSNGKTAIGILLILISGIGAFSLYQFQQQQKSDAELADIKAALSNFQQQQSPVAENQEALKNALAQLGEQQLKLDGRQQTLEQKWQETQQQRPNEWLLAESSYLLRMAGRKLWLEQDLTTAIALLTDADSRLQAMADPSLIPLRKALAEDIAALKAAPQVDIEGLSLRVGILVDNLDQLKIKGSDPKRTITPQDDEVSSEISDWQENLTKSAKHFASNFVTIRRRSGDVEALLSPDQSAYLLENVRLQLQLAQLSLQHQDQANFADHLKKAQTWLKNYYEDDSTTQFMLKEIETLQQAEITAHYPVEFKSQPLLEKVMTERGQATVR